MLLGQELKFKNKLCNLKLGTFFSALPGLGASALSGRVDANRACGCKHHLEHAGHCLNHTDFLDLIQCLLDIIQDILHILDTY